MLDLSHMVFSFKRASQLLAIMGALMVSVHGAGVLFSFCQANSQCLASVYFGVPNSYVPTTSIDMVVSGSSSNVLTEDAPVTVAWSDMHGVVQVTGLYALVIGMLLYLLLGLKDMSFPNFKPKKI